MLWGTEWELDGMMELDDGSLLNVIFAIWSHGADVKEVAEDGADDGASGLS